MANQLLMMAPEPVIPLWFNLIAAVVLVLYAAVIVAAAITLSRAASFSTAQRAVWVIVLIVLPLVGAISWLIVYATSRGDRYVASAPEQ